MLINFVQIAGILIVAEARYIGYNDPNFIKGFNNPPLPITSPLEKRPSGFLDYTNDRPKKFVRPIIKHGTPIVSKSFFLHETPVEKIPLEPKYHTIHPRKHYNILFIKTPLYQNSRQNFNVFPEVAYF